MERKKEGKEGEREEGGKEKIRKEGWMGGWKEGRWEEMKEGRIDE